MNSLTGERAGTRAITGRRRQPGLRRPRARGPAAVAEQTPLMLDDGRLVRLLAAGQPT